MIWVPTRWGIPEPRQGQLSFCGRKDAIHHEVKAGWLGPSLLRKVRPEATVIPFPPAYKVFQVCAIIGILSFQRPLFEIRIQGIHPPPRLVDSDFWRGMLKSRPHSPFLQNQVALI